MIRNLALALACGLITIGSLTSNAEDWPRFRGPHGNGVAATSKVPLEWSPQANLSWKTELPGPGASSPIIVDGKVFVTCYSGYGLSQEDPGDIDNLVRHLICVDLASGKKLWQKDVPSSGPEDPYTGIGVTAHGYASHTPVSDGTHVFAFFGKEGVHAFDMDGKELWQAEVGRESDPARWGSSSSPVVHDNIVIVTAAAESQAIIGFDKESGKEVWRQEAKGLDNMWGTPTLVKIDDDRTDLVMCVAKEIWGLDPANGKLRWYADATDARQSYASVVLDGNRVYAVTSRGGGSIAVDAGGSGNISESNTVWTGRDTGGYASPVQHGSKLYVISRGMVTAVDAKSGERVQRLRLQGADQTGGRFGSLDYPSPIVIGDHMYYMNGSGQMFVFALGDEMELVSVNRVTPDKEIFWGSPAVSNDALVMRSQQHLYCVTDKGERVNPDDNLASNVEATEATEEQPADGRRGGQRIDPMAMFNRMDTNEDGKLTEDELEGNRMADRLMTLDKDSNQEISSEEFRSGIASLFTRRGGGGGRRGGGGRENTRPERPQRPGSAWNQVPSGS
jgi:hypothetical protein